jgi:uncharacterized circularly permuted ATP-grasp superfamily protein
MARTAPAELQAPRGLDALRAFGDRLAPGAWSAGSEMRAGSEADPFDEGLASGPHATEPDRLLHDSLASVDLDVLSAAVASDVGARGVSFGTAEGERAFRIDPVPRLFGAEQWRELSAGIVQRVRALELFVRDVYGAQSIVREGIVPERALAGAQHYEPALAGTGELVRSWITVAGLDIVRDSDGVFKVLEDNLRTPSGIAYAVATREVLDAHLPASGLSVRSLQDAFATLGEALRQAAPVAAGDDPTIVLLSDGKGNSALWEHVTIAEQIGVPLVLAEQLSVRRGRLYARLPGGERAVDVVYRRTDEDRLHDEHGEPTHVARLLLEPVLEGTLACVNAFGTGVADDKLLHAYVEDMVRFYLGEEPLLASVETYDPAQPGVLEMVLERIDELVIKPRSGHGGYGVVICPHARAEDVRAVAAKLQRSPESFVAQETVMLSTHPTVNEGRLEPRHVDLRPFAIASGDDVHVLPGGLTRVAFDAGALVVNSSQNGGSKDTWVLA